MTRGLLEWRWAAATAALLLAACSVSGCSEFQTACDTGRAKALVKAARSSPLIGDVPSAWEPQARYAGCDQDDEFVYAGREIREPRDDREMSAYLSAHGVREVPGADGPPCRWTQVAGVTFSVNVGAGHLELVHYLTYDNTCESAAPTPSG